mmetsp:Transcript_24566/g.77031  ORF Transcript_24566/g.77031 Transcript_24566/m.77031 type:complete len:207 (-) Transcript_24566:81-701(-)
MHWRQSLNLVAVRTLWRVICEPRLVLPTVEAPTISEVDFAALRSLGVVAVVFDKDNTLTAPYAKEVHPLCEAGLRECVATFGRENLAILSNSAGTLDDEDFAAAAAFEKTLDLPVIRHAVKKPGKECMDEVVKHFETASGEKLSPSKIAMVGDRLLTDIVFGNLYDARTVHVRPLTLKGDNPVALVVRFFENRLFLPLAKLVRRRA